MTTYTTRRAPRTHDSWETQDAVLKKFKGYKHLAEGAFSTVYAKPGSNRVLKIARDDCGYLAFLKFAVKNQKNPFVPKIFSVEIIKGYGFKLIVVLMEKLKRVRSSTKLEAISSAFRRYIRDEYSYYTFGETKAFLETTKWMNDKSFKFLDQVGAMIRRATSNGHDTDLHDGNVMQRGGVLVVTDPLVP